MKDLETLLEESRHTPITDQIPKDKECKDVFLSKNLQRAKSNISFLEFIKKVGIIIENELKNDKVEFLPKNDTYRKIKDPDFSFNNPIITFNIVNREISKGGNYKPSYKENLSIGEIHSIRYDYYIQFDFFNTSFENTYKLMEDFEYIMYAYSSYIKEEGIVEYYFLKQIDDEDHNIFREKVTSLSVIYYVQTERQMVIAREEVKNNINKITASVKGEEQIKISLYED